jgi:hypothetical protein
VTTPLVYYPGILSPVVHPVSDGLIPLSAVQQVSWTTLSSVTNEVTSEWRVTAYQISSSIAVAYDAYFRVHVVENASTPGLSAPVTHPIDWHYLNPQISWNTDQNRSAQKASAFAVIQTRSSSCSVKFNVRNPVSVQQASHFRVRNSVSKTSAVEWNLLESVNSQKKSTYNVYISRAVQKAASWNTLTLTVSASKAVSWMTRKSVSLLKRAAWNVNGSSSRSHSSSWMTRVGINKTEAVKWNVFDYITKSSASAWAVQQQVIKQEASRFRVLDSVEVKKSATWNTMMSVNKSADFVEARNTISGPVTHALDADGYTYWPTVAWNYVNPVISSVESLFNTLNSVSTEIASSWKLNQNLSSSAQVQYNVLNSVTSQAIIEYDVGLVLAYPIRMTSAPRTDFAY